MNRRSWLVPYLGSFFSGLLIVLAFQPFAGWWCGWLALAPAWIAMRTSARVRRSPLRYGYVIGLMFVLGCFWWVGAVTFTGISIMTLVISFYPSLWFLFLIRVLGLPEDERELSFRELVTYSAMAGIFWVTLEWLRSWFMSGFNWNELGVSQVPSLYFRQLAALGGVPLITLVLVAFGILAGEALLSGYRRQWKSLARASLAGVLLLAASGGYGGWRLGDHAAELPRASLAYAGIQPNIPELPYDRGSKEEIFRLEMQAMTTEQDLSAQAFVSHPDLLIWPEAVTTQRLISGSMISQVIEHIQADYHGALLLGAEELDGGKLYNTAYLLGPEVGARQLYHKVYLVILGEYLPWTDVFPWLKQFWGRGIEATAGTVPGHLLLAKEGLSFAPLMCFEDTQPLVVNEAAARHPDFFVTMINAGWYSGRLAIWCQNQHLANATLRCVEHDRPMIRVADTGISCEIDRDGQVIARLPENPGDPLETRGILARRLVIYPWRATLYESWGDWVGQLSRWSTLAVCVLYAVRRKGLLRQTELN